MTLDIKQVLKKLKKRTDEASAERRARVIEAYPIIIMYQIKTGNDFSEIQLWLKENNIRVYFDSMVGMVGVRGINFETKEDAMAFKLRWT